MSAIIEWISNDISCTCRFEKSVSSQECGSSGLFGKGYSGVLYNGYGGLPGLSVGYANGGLSGWLGYLSCGYGGYGVKEIPILQIPIVIYKGVRIGKGVANGFGKGFGLGTELKELF
ncbi:hypothetical protein CHS0354_010819 [Potamilus streckersoni]|uniref:Uncharacterized protein n=1 Tax=Potamilus streckersoni TaxID=2493646 RepID=A0AAE0W8N3_9BIVA|nr:hypothetical protein CHS0354_010819 [Potamilus streckersoni]